MTTAPATALDSQLPHFDASTVQRAVVFATPQATYDAIWSVDLLDAPLARTPRRAAIALERAAARFCGTTPPQPVPRSAHLRDMLGDERPLLLLNDASGHEVVLGLLWTPPAGVHRCAPEQFADFQAPGLAKVVWSLSVYPFGAGHALLVAETRSQTTNAVAARRFRLLWTLISPFAALLRSQVLQAIKTQAEA